MCVKMIIRVRTLLAFAIASIVLMGNCEWRESNIVGYKTEVSNGQTNTVTVTIPEKELGGPSRSKQVQQSTIAVRQRLQLHMAECLAFSTVRLECITSKGASIGTGFFYNIPHPTNPNLHIPIIVSNRHVVDAAIETRMPFTVSTNNFPSGETMLIKVDNRFLHWIGHPDPSVDICVLPIGAVLKYIEGQHKTPIIFPFSHDAIPSAEYMKSVTQLDEVIMIGYPGGLWDHVNNQPIFRRGVLATNPTKNFAGRREFLVDMPVYCGSSGSPILLYSEGMHYDRSRGHGVEGVILGGRLKLIGINFATMQTELNGTLVPVPIPTVVENNTNQPITLEPHVRVPNNLGVVIHASRLLEIENEFYKVATGK